MQAISLWQPWATLIAIGAKRFETRSWPLMIKKPFAIHAALKWSLELEELCYTQPFFNRLRPLLPSGAASFGRVLPFGCVIAVCDGALAVQSMGGASKAFLNDGTVVSSDEFHFGDYSPGRFASHLGLIRPLKAPIPIKGRQRIFTVPDELIAEVA